jgi:hypothetical protein
MLRLYFTLFLLQSFILLFSQSGAHLFSGTQFISNGQIGILTDGPEAGIVLPALLGKKSSAGWSAGASLRSALDDLVEISAAGHLPLPWKDQVALGIQHTGIEGYSEQRITLGYARKLFEQLHVAVQFDLNRNSVAEYDDLYATSWAVCFVAPLMKHVSFSAFIYNPLGNAGTIDLPSLARLGLLYSPSQKLGVAMEIEKDWRYEMRLKAGMDYKIHPRIALRWGVSTEPAMIHAGIAWNLFHQMSVSGGWRYHSRLGSVLSGSISQSR